MARFNICCGCCSPLGGRRSIVPAIQGCSQTQNLGALPNLQQLAARGVDTPPEANPQVGLPEVSSQPPTAVSTTQNAGCTGILGSLNVPSIVPNPCFAGVSPLAAGAAESVLSNSTGAGVSPLAAGLAESAPIVTQPYGTTPIGSDAALSVGTGTTTKQPDQIAPTMPAVIANPQVVIPQTSDSLPAHGPASAAAQANAPVDPVTGLPVAALGNATVAADINQGKSVTPEQIASACAMQRAQVAANCNTCFMSKIVPALAMSGVGAAFAPVIGGLLPGAATATAAATPINVALSNAITSGVIGQAMGGCGLKSGLMAGVGAGLSAAAPYVSGITNTISGDISGGLQNLGLGACVSNTLGSAATGALGKAATSAGLAALTGGCIGKAAEAGAIAGGVSPLVNAGVGAALKDLCLTCCTAKTLAKIGASGLSQGAASSLLGGSFGTGLESGLVTGAINAAKCAVKGLGANNPLCSMAQSSMNDYLANNPDNIDASIADMNLYGDMQNTLNAINGTTPDTTTQDLTPDEIASGLSTVSLDDIASGTDDAEQAANQAISDYDNEPQEVTVTSTRIPDQTDITPVNVSDNSSASIPQVSPSPLNDTEIVSSVTNTPPPEDITPVLPTIDPKDLNFPKPDTVTTDTPKVSVGTASQTGSGTGGGSGSGGLGGSGALKSIAPLVAIYGQTGDPKILEDIQQMVSQNTPKSDKGESRELEDLVMGKKNYDDETENSAKGGLVGYASGGSSGQFGNLFSSVNMFCCTSPQWSPSMRNNVLTYQGTGGKKPNFLLPMHLCTGSAQGRAKGGALPSHYREAAPEGHHPEFITGLTGFYACGGGTGQSDDIPAMLHDGDYVMDAETVSALGDGSSKAGREVLEGFMHKVPHKKVIGGNPVPAKIADGEYVFPAAFVTALGKGDNKAGAKILDGLREKLRAHKRAAPVNKIPPKAKSPLDYIKGAKG